MSKRYITIKGSIFKVKKYDDEKNLKEGNAYIKGKIVYPFRGKLRDMDSKNKVGVYIDESGEHVFIKPISNKGIYKASNIYEIDEDYKKSIISDDGLNNVFDETLTAEMGELFTPEIDDSDNRLQRMVKQVIKHKKIDLKNYENRFKSPTDLNNCKRSLLKHGTMSMDKCEKWCDILDVQFEIIFKDKEGCPNPMGITGIIRSDGSYEEVETDEVEKDDYIDE